VLYAPKIDKSEGRIDWSRPAAHLHNLVRGLSPFPGAFFETDLGKGPERIKVLRATSAPGEGLPGRLIDSAPTVACGLGALRLIEIQRAGRAPMSAEAFLRGIRLAPGDQL
jgi:methionyl-tRNA formyltransferase